MSGKKSEDNNKGWKNWERVTGVPFGCGTSIGGVHLISAVQQSAVMASRDEK